MLRLQIETPDFEACMAILLPELRHTPSSYLTAGIEGSRPDPRIQHLESAGGKYGR